MNDDFNYDGYEDDVDLHISNKPSSNRVDRFKGESKKVYRVALLYFHPLPVTIRRAFARKAKKDGTEVDMAAVKDMVGKAFEKRAADLGKSAGDLDEWEKLDLSVAQFKTYSSYYHEDVGTVVSRLGKDGAEADKVWRLLGEPRTYYSTIALFYPLDASGNLDVKNIERDGYVKLWRFGKGTFTTLFAKDQMLQEYNQSLANSDLKLECKSAQFQTFDIDPAGASMWLKSPKLKAKFLPMAYALYDKLVDARELSTADVKRKLAEAGNTPEESGGRSGAGGGPAKGDVTEDEIEDLLQNV